MLHLVDLCTFDAHAASSLPPYLLCCCIVLQRSGQHARLVCTKTIRSCLDLSKPPPCLVRRANAVSVSVSKVDMLRRTRCCLRCFCRMSRRLVDRQDPRTNDWRSGGDQDESLEAKWRGSRRVDFSNEVSGVCARPPLHARGPQVRCDSLKDSAHVQHGPYLSMCSTPPVDNDDVEKGWDRHASLAPSEVVDMVTKAWLSDPTWPKTV